MIIQIFVFNPDKNLDRNRDGRTSATGRPTIIHPFINTVCTLLRNTCVVLHINNSAFFMRNEYSISINQYICK